MSVPKHSLITGGMILSGTNSPPAEVHRLSDSNTNVDTCISNHF